MAIMHTVKLLCVSVALARASGASWKELGAGCCNDMTGISASEKQFDQMYSGNCQDKCASFGSSLAIVFPTGWCTCLREEFPVPQCYPLCAGPNCCGSSGAGVVTYQRVSLSNATVPLDAQAGSTCGQFGCCKWQTHGCKTAAGGCNQQCDWTQWSTDANPVCTCGPAAADWIQPSQCQSCGASNGATGGWKFIGDGCCNDMTGIPASEKQFDQMYNGNCQDKCASFGSSLAIVFPNSWCTCLSQSFPVPQCYPLCSGPNCCGSSGQGVLTYQRTAAAEQIQI